MTRIALLDATDGIAAAVRAALGADAVVACSGGNVPGDASLVIAEIGGDGVFSPAALFPPETTAPLLLLVDQPLAIDPALFGKRRVAVLQKPFDLIDLRRIVRALLHPAGQPASPSEPMTAACAERNQRLSPISGNRGQALISATASGWLAPARVAAGVATTLTAATRMDGAVWIVGEPGTGTDHVAAALAAAWDRDREPVVWQESDSLASSVARLGDAGRVLWVPGLDEKPLPEQRAFERYLALEPKRRVAVTSADDPEAAVAAGTLLRSLHHALSRMSLRLAPLRERREDIAGLAIAIASAVAAKAFGTERVVLTDDARRILESYPWPGNLAELDAVVTRSVIASGAQDSLIVELGVDLGVEHLRFLPDHLRLPPEFLATPDLAGASATTATRNGIAARTASSPTGTSPPATPASPLSTDTSPPTRRAVVVTLGDMAAARAAKPSDTAFANAAQAVETAGVPPRLQEPHSGVEAVLAAFAHDIRNPMSTIKTFAGLQAASAGADDSELARLAIEACERVDEHLEFLQRYAELTPAAAGAVDVVETLGEAVDAGGDPSALTIVARRALWVQTDATVARFVADAIVAECRSRAASAAATSTSSAAPLHIAEADIATLSPGTAALSVGGAAALPVTDPAAHSAAIEIRIPVGSAAVDRLNKWVEGASLPWRLALAREAARRGGGDLQVNVEDGQMRLQWRLPRVEEANHDDQAGSPDRRRRSRSS